MWTYILHPEDRVKSVKRYINVCISTEALHLIVCGELYRKAQTATEYSDTSPGQSSVTLLPPYPWKRCNPPLKNCCVFSEDAPSTSHSVSCFFFFSLGGKKKKSSIWTSGLCIDITFPTPLSAQLVQRVSPPEVGAGRRCPSRGRLPSPGPRSPQRFCLSRKAPAAPGKLPGSPRRALAPAQPGI